MKNQNEELEIDLLSLMQALWRKAWAIFLSVAIMGGAFFAGSIFLVKPKYQAETLLYVNSSDISLGGAKVSISQSELTAAKTLVDTYVVILNTRTTIDEVIEQTGVPYTYTEVKNMISASAVNDTEVFSVKVTSTSPNEAALLANTIAEVLPGKIASIVEGSSVRIVDYAVTPASAASPNIIKNTLIGVILGFSISCAVIIVIELMDDLIHDSDYLSQTYDLPILAVIPDLRTNKHSNAYYQATNLGTQN